MGALGRDPAFFNQMEGSVSAQVARGVEHAFVANDPVANPYLRWIMTGVHVPVLALAFGPEHYETIGARSDRLQVVHGTLETITNPGADVDGCNLSDIFEYMS